MNEKRSGWKKPPQGRFLRRFCLAAERMPEDSAAWTKGYELHPHPLEEPFPFRGIMQFAIPAS